MKILGIESSSDMLSFGAVDEEIVIFEFKKKVERGASFIPEYCNRIFKENLFDLGKVDCLAVGAGPGSFTGLRISFSIIKGWGCALGVPVVPVGSFFSIAGQVKDAASEIAVVADARRGLVYSASFKVRNGGVVKTEKERLSLLEDFMGTHPEHLFVTYDSSIREKAKEINPEARVYPEDVWPDVMGILGEARCLYKKGKSTPLSKLEPLYIYPKDCQVRNV